MFLNLRRRQFYNACRKSALEDAIAAIDAPKLNEAYGGHSNIPRTARN